MWLRFPVVRAEQSTTALTCQRLQFPSRGCAQRRRCSAENSHGAERGACPNPSIQAAAWGSGSGAKEESIQTPEDYTYTTSSAADNNIPTGFSHAVAAHSASVVSHFSAYRASILYRSNTSTLHNPVRNASPLNLATVSAHHKLARGTSHPTLAFMSSGFRSRNAASSRDCHSCPVATACVRFRLGAISSCYRPVRCVDNNISRGQAGVGGSSGPTGRRLASKRSEQRDDCIACFHTCGWPVVCARLTLERAQ